MLCVRTAGCAIPGVLLVLLPKCPACLAAWIAVATGASVPVAAAARLNTIVVLLCVFSIAAMMVRFGLRRRATQDGRYSRRREASACVSNHAATGSDSRLINSRIAISANILRNGDRDLSCPCDVRGGW